MLRLTWFGASLLGNHHCIGLVLESDRLLLMKVKSKENHLVDAEEVKAETLAALYTKDLGD